MPGKHAPASPRSFYLSVARAVSGALAVLALVVLIAMAAVNSGDDAPAATKRTEDPAASATPTKRVSPSPPPGSPSPTTTTTAREIRARTRVSVLVLNATTRAGLAARVRTKLLAAGYDDVAVGNAPDRARSIVYYRGSFRPEAARLFEDLDQQGAVRAAPDDLQGDARLTIILGDDFQE